MHCFVLKPTDRNLHSILRKLTLSKKGEKGNRVKGGENNSVIFS